MKQKRFAMRGLLALLLCGFTLNSGQAAPLARDLVQKPAVVKPTEGVVIRPGIPLQRPGGGSDSSKISNVTVTTQGEFYTGQYTYVDWQWPGHEMDPVDIIMNGKKLNKDGPWNKGRPFTFYIPYDLDQRDYSVTVRSVSNPDNKAHKNVSIKASYIMPGNQPQQDIYYIQSSLLRTEWSYKGNPGPLKLELYQTNNSTPVATINPSLGPGNNGSGFFNWMIPSNIPSGRYYVAITSLGNSRVAADSKQFYIGKEPAPVLKSLAPLAALPGPAKVTVQGSNLKYLSTYKAMIHIPNADPVEAGTGNFMENQFDLTNIPNIYGKLNIKEKNGEHRQLMMQPKLLFVKKNQVESNRLLFNVRSPYPILDSLNRDTVYPGDTIVVYGGNWELSKLQGYTVSFHLPGGSYQTKPSPIGGPTSQVGFFPNLPDVVYSGAFSVKIPDVFAGKSAAEQDLINRSTVQLTIFGPDTFQSNKLGINIRKKSTIVSANPEKVPLAATYSPQAPNRTNYYKGNSEIITAGYQKTAITMVRNSSQYSFKLAYKPEGQVNKTPLVDLAPGQSTTAFNNMSTKGEWEAFWGPESGSFLGKYPSVGIEISWRKQ
jgi:hypothetical protein